MQIRLQGYDAPKRVSGQAVLEENFSAKSILDASSG